MRPNKKKATSILVVLLIYVVIAGNTSGEFVFCINTDGHITLEPVNHNHFEEHTHIEQNVLFPLGHEHDIHVDHSNCKPCIDIPVFIGLTNNRLVLKRIKPNPNTFVSNLETKVVDNSTFTPQAVPLCVFSVADENRFLSTIILLV